MAMGFEQDIVDTRADCVNPFEVERGGIMSLATLSGIQYAVYEPNPTANTIPVGLMMHDQEEVDLYRAVAPWRVSRRYPAFTPYPYLIQGTVITNAVHPDIDPACVRSGAPAYLAPSGLITCVPTYNPRRIGTFRSTLNDSTVLAPTASSTGSVLRVAGNQAIVNPDPVLVNTAGWVRITIHIRN
jgi:hypothetical protein